MKNSGQKGFIVPLLIIIIALLVIGGGLYVYQKNKVSIQTPQNIVTTASTTVTTTQSPTSIPIKTSVVGMSKYTDSTFGFSFWYPSSWKVIQATVQNQNVYPGGTVIKQLNVTNGQNTITVEEFTSPTFSITDSTGVGACPYCTTTHYYFDPNLHAWMVQYPNGKASGDSETPAPADVSQNTMGGLQMLAGSQRFAANTIIPLSARNFVIVTVDGELATGSSDPQVFAKNITATDPLVATPVSQAEQTQTIQAEADAYANSN